MRSGRIRADYRKEQKGKRGGGWTGSPDDVVNGDPPSKLICQQRWSKCRMKDTNSRGEVLHWANLIIANMELKFLHSLQWRAILMKCLMVFILFRVLGSFKISVATQKVSWFITSSNCFRLPLPTEESSLNKSSTYLKHVTEGFKTGLKGRILSFQQMVCQKTVTVTNIQS